jgi:hypothetical protein
MKRLVRKANTDSDCMQVIEEFLSQHVKNYTIEYFNASTNENGVNVNVTIKLSDIIEVNMAFVCQYGKIIDYNIFVNGENATLEDTKKMYEINEQLNEYIEEKI